MAQDCTAVFSYGSNSLAQLSRRVANPRITSMPARLDDYTRIFAGHSVNWDGAIASLARSSGSRTFGSVAYLSAEELNKLDLFEGGYTRTRIEVHVRNLETSEWQAEATCAVAYIKDDPTWIGPPSQAYLTAIHVMLREQYLGDDDITVAVCRKCELDKIEEYSKWTRPPCQTLDIRSLCVEVNARLPYELKWEMPSTIPEITRKLAAVGITSATDLQRCLEDDREGFDLNKRLDAEGFKPFRTETICILTQLILPP